jgi:hypothetical protein
MPDDVEDLNGQPSQFFEAYRLRVAQLQLHRRRHPVRRQSRRSHWPLRRSHIRVIQAL